MNRIENSTIQQPIVNQETPTYLETMSNHRNKPEWTLKEISEWTKKDSQVSIPAIQRGLVWKPQQVELLWDSILRQFPIGSFTLSSSIEESESSYNLLDGQQRWNAISLGYGSVLDDISTARSILWFDLKPEEVWKSKNTTRKFFVRATTKAHPWGYEANDECGRFNTAQKREALSEFGLEDKTIYKDGISLSETYPIKSGLPLPLFWLLEAGEKSNGDRTCFVNCIRDRIQDNREKHTFRLKKEEPTDDLLAKYQPIFEAVTHYMVPTIYLEQSIIDQESEDIKTIDEEDWTDIEILFARIGTGGTQITQNELIYSAIKAYWPRYVKEENDRLADKYMPPFSLISLAFRLALSPNENGNLAGGLSVKKVRQIAADKKSIAYNSILNLYKQEDGQKFILEKVLEIVDSWLTNKDSLGNATIPTVLRTGIARTSPDVYLLLMSIAKIILDNNMTLKDEDESLIRATAFYLHWMVDKGDKARAASLIYTNMKDSQVEQWADKIKKAILKLYARQTAIPLISKDSFSHLFGNEIGSDSRWRTWEEDRANKPWWPLWNIVAYNREMLLYAQRKYLCQKFPNYDPAKLDLWEEYNRPWDYDHIIPQDWIYQYRAWKKTFSDYCYNWKDNNGNMAAIPFETNRAKSNEADWQEYIDNKSLLLADEDIERYHELFHSYLTENEEEAHRFAQKTFNRLCKIYSEVYDLLSPIDLNEGNTFSTVKNGLSQRRDLLLSVSEKLGSKIYFECNGKEYIQTRNEEWAKPWMSTGLITQNGYFAAITIGMYPDCSLVKETEKEKAIEIGLRKKPDSYELTGEKPSEELLEKCISMCNGLDCKLSDGPWWHIGTYISINTSVDTIVDYLKRLAEFASSKLE